jgi:hypothetical protein
VHHVGAAARRRQRRSDAPGGVHHVGPLGGERGGRLLVDHDGGDVDPEPEQFAGQERGMGDRPAATQ